MLQDWPSSAAGHGGRLKKVPPEASSSLVLLHCDSKDQHASFSPSQHPGEEAGVFVSPTFTPYPNSFHPGWSRSSHGSGKHLPLKHIKGETESRDQMQVARETFFQRQLAGFLFKTTNYFYSLPLALALPKSNLNSKPPGRVVRCACTAGHTQPTSPLLFTTPSTDKQNKNSTENSLQQTNYD